MNTAHRKKEITGGIIHLLYLIFFTSLVFSLRAISSLSIVAILLGELLTNRSALSSLFKKNIQQLFLAGCFLLFLLDLIALLYTNDRQEGWNDIRIKTGLLITPLAICVSSYITVTTRKKLLFHYCMILAVASLYCIAIAFRQYLESENLSAFFYHSLVKALNQHAVYFSLLVVVGIVFLFESITQTDSLFARSFHIGLAIYFSIFLFLLSSKLVLLFYLFYLLSLFIRLIAHNRVRKVPTAIAFTLCILTLILVFAIRNPISARFYEILDSDIKIVRQDSFKKSDYFNGLQFRLLQWKFVSEILTEKKRWLIGVSPADAQSILNEKYVSKNMYTGEPARGDRGYMAYNTHNQFLQTALENGIIGLIALLTICCSLLNMALQNWNHHKGFIILLLLGWLFSEAVFETQYGIMIFTFFPLFLYADNTATLSTPDV